MADLSPQQPGVLVVDDDPSLLTLLYLALQDHGLTVWTAADEGQAVKVYHKYHDSILAVLLDSRPSGSNGQATVAALRQINPAVRCCLVTDPPGRQRKADAPAPDDVEVLQRPFGFGRLVQVLLRLAAPRRAAGE
jgi:DNA-binding NtrC family response regulator